MKYEEWVRHMDDDQLKNHRAAAEAQANTYADKGRHGYAHAVRRSLAIVDQVIQERQD